MKMTSLVQRCMVRPGMVRPSVVQPGIVQPSMVRRSHSSRLVAAAMLAAVSWFLYLAFAGILSAQAALPAADTKASVASTLSYQPTDALNAPAFDDFYNMQYDRALQEFDEVERRHPESAFAVNHLLMAVLFRELHRTGTLNSGEYAGNSFIAATHRPVDAKAQQQIKALAEKANQMEEASLRRNSKDVAAIYCRGVTRALYSTYLGLVERAWLSALRNAVGARRDHERVLDLAPEAQQAKLIVGAHNYVVGSLPWGAKAGVSLFGLSGSKEKGFRYLQECAQGGGETAIDAKILLALFLRREQRYGEALQIVRALSPSYPHSLLLALEEGNLLRASGSGQQADAVYRKVLQAGRDGKYAGLHYEISALSLGDLLRSENNLAEAARAYELVNEVPGAEAEMLQKANLGAGEMYDSLHQRDLALKKYQAVIAVDSKSVPAQTARKCVASPCVTG